jgi:hypothetical protein
MISVYFLVGAERAYVAAMANDPDLSQSWHSAAMLLGVTAGDVAELQARVDELPGAWCVAPHQDCDGEHLAMLMLDDDDEAAPTFVVCREAGRVQVDVCRGDSYARLGSYGTIAQAVQGVAARLARPDTRPN